MRRLLILVMAGALAMAMAVPAGADGASVYVNTAHDDVWGFNYHHLNPCTGLPAVIEWEAEHRNMGVDHDGDWDTLGDQHKSIGVMELLWATHSDPGWEVLIAKDKLAQNGWDEEVWFADEDQATVNYSVMVKAINEATGEWYKSNHSLRWVSNGQGELIHGQGSQTDHTTGCKHKGPR